MKTKYSLALLTLSLLAPSLSIAKSFDNQALNYYCGNNNVEYEKRIEVGKGTRVYLNQGPFYQIQQQGKYDPTLDFINQQIVSSGVSEQCSEFLLTNGFLQAMDNGKVIARVFFDLDKSKLTDKSKYILDTIVNLLELNKKNLLVEGHTDSLGSEKYNFALGLKRSKSVQAYLQQLGVAADKIKVTSAGETSPIGDNNNAQGRVKNRRVEIK
jgi:outer membrane protein OmpA-like peptidoglycan-associated protein